MVDQTFSPRVLWLSKHVASDRRGWGRIELKMGTSSNISNRLIIAVAPWPSEPNPGIIFHLSLLPLQPGFEDGVLYVLNPRVCFDTMFE